MTRRILHTPLGTFTATADAGAVTQLCSGSRPVSGEEQPEDSVVLDRLETQLEEYARGQCRSFDLPLRLRGTEFQRQVWTALQEIPWGETRTYGQVAAAIGRAKASRAVGGACGKNNLLLLVPCHRVVGSDGSLTGFTAEGGVELKQRLLHLERNGKQDEKRL